MSARRSQKTTVCHSVRSCLSPVWESRHRSLVATESRTREVSLLPLRLGSCPAKPMISTKFLVMVFLLLAPHRGTPKRGSRSSQTLPLPFLARTQNSKSGRRPKQKRHGCRARQKGPAWCLMRRNKRIGSDQAAEKTAGFAWMVPRSDHNDIGFELLATNERPGVQSP